MRILELENVSFSYGKTKVLDNISYSFDAGHVYSIVGKSGAGKTTLTIYTIRPCKANIRTYLL